jgi:hypothetical protein
LAIASLTASIRACRMASEGSALVNMMLPPSLTPRVTEASRILPTAVMSQTRTVRLLRAVYPTISAGLHSPPAHSRLRWIDSRGENFCQRKIDTQDMATVIQHNLSRMNTPFPNENCYGNRLSIGEPGHQGNTVDFKPSLFLSMASLSALRPAAVFQLERE